MSMLFQGQKDFWSGLIFLIIGAAAVYIGSDYAMGTAGRMGPAEYAALVAGELARWRQVIEEAGVKPD